MEKAIITYNDLCNAKKELETAVGLTFKEQSDNDSKCENNGHGVSFLLEQGNASNASTRCQVWITVRKQRNGNAYIRHDIYIGGTWIQSGAIQITTLQQWWKNNDKGQGNTYHGVPFDEVVKWFEVNKLGRFAKVEKTTKNAKTEATKTKARTTTAKVKKA